MDNRKIHELDLTDLERVSGGAWTGEETELSMLCAGCRCVRVFKKDEWGRWRCSECNGTETMRYQDLWTYERRRSIHGRPKGRLFSALLRLFYGDYVHTKMPPRSLICGTITSVCLTLAEV